MLVTSNFSFSYSVFIRLVLQTRKNQGLFGKGLTLCELVQSSTDPEKEDLWKHFGTKRKSSNKKAKEFFLQGKMFCDKILKNEY